jgi:hypothetical protein
MAVLTFRNNQLNPGIFGTSRYGIWQGLSNKPNIERDARRRSNVHHEVFKQRKFINHVHDFKPLLQIDVFLRLFTPF